MKFLELVLASIALISTASAAPIASSSSSSSGKTTSQCNWNNTNYGIVNKEARVHAKDIWDFFVEKIGNENAAAAVIGNIYAKSNLMPNDLEPQWIYYERKENLLNYAKANGKSISDLDMQLNFLWNEINEDYSYLASNAYVKEFESPINQSESVLRNRANLSKMFKDACGSQ
ncbi:hypothetical protein PIROE2DRAFT_17775 [Piromyces sp. E2]|nr:hypothetical protein PIROE2DRAFT_17775 [Piromyces sp. E2]|eukprot:OUM57289.1 hypothetical protein PIROE2DRAFT_17775 [Piromyces sp. E2]